MNKARVPKGGGTGPTPKRNAMPISGEGSSSSLVYYVQYARRYIPQISFYSNGMMALQKAHNAGKGFTGKSYRDGILSELNKYWEGARPTSGMRGIKLLHDRTWLQAKTGTHSV